MYKVVFVRHGESVWNKKGLFTGWVDAEINKKKLTDVDLTKRGVTQAITGARELIKNKFVFDVAFTSYLERSIKTLDIILDQMNLMWIPVEKDWRLNERHYGDLQGLNKKAMTKKYGEAKVYEWRRSYDIRPPAIKKTNKYYEGDSEKYKDAKYPQAECLKDVVDRVVPYWNEFIAPVVTSGKRTLISAHGNSIRALVKYFDNVPEDEIPHLNIPYGVPLVYEFDQNMKAIKHYYLGNAKTIRALEKEIANQAKVG